MQSACTRGELDRFGGGSIESWWPGRMEFTHCASASQSAGSVLLLATQEASSIDVFLPTDTIKVPLEDSIRSLFWVVRSGSCGTCSTNRVERSPMAKAAAGLPAAVGKTTRGFESLPSPPPSPVLIVRLC